MTRVRLFAMLLVLASTGVASADVPPRPTPVPDDTPPHRDPPHPTPGRCGAGSSLGLAGVATAWGLFWVGQRLARSRTRKPDPTR
jgi:hypothetical protein